MDAFAEGYTFFEKNSGSYTGATIGDAYVGKVNREIATLLKNMNAFEGFKTKSDAFKGNILADSNIPIKIVSDRLGHSSTSFTADVYIHPDAEHQTGAAEAMENILSGEPPITKRSKITRLSNYSQR